MTSSRPKVHFAVVGLGDISQEAALPAFQNTKHCQLAALISGDPAKHKALSRKYGVQSYGYEQFEQALSENQVKAVYIGLPNTMHREYTERAAKAGVHVLCEKPMAVSEKDCEAMIKAARSAQIKLMIAYRLHFTGAHLEAVKLVRSGKLGELRFFNSSFGQQVERGNIRLRREMGGGTLFDIGIYCLNAARYLFRDEPEEVFAWTARNGEERFAEIEEMTSVILRFPGNRLAAFTCSFGSAKISSLELVGTKGTLRMQPAYSYEGEIHSEIAIGKKQDGKTFPPGDQFGAEFDYFANCILKNEDPEPSGEEGLADVRIINALYRSAKSGRPVLASGIKRQKRPEPDQQIKRPPVKAPKPVHARAPGGEED